MIKYESQIKSKLDEIAKILIGDIDPGGIGLLDGRAGIILFLFSYSRYTENEIYEERAIELLHECMDMIDKHDEVSLHYSQGIPGLAWTLDYLAKNEFIEIMDTFHPFDKIICDSMQMNFETKNWDALHGGIGTCNYLFSRLENEYVKESILKAIKVLESICIEDGTTAKWESYNQPGNDFSYNFGLAHGIPSIISFLVKCIENNLDKVVCLRLLQKSVHYITTNTVEGKENVFPTMIFKDGTVQGFSRLAWCYGDPGVVVALIQANKVLKSLDEIIKLTLEKICQRKTIEKTNIVDSCICHGTVGIMHIIHYISLLEYGQYLDSQTLDYWIECSLEMAKFDDGAAGYKTFIKNDVGGNPNFEISHGLLEGISGNGMCLLTLLDGKTRWNECVFIS